MKQIIKPLFILAGMTTLLCSFSNTKVLQKANALENSKEATIYEDHGHKVDTNGKYLITFISGTDYYVVSPKNTMEDEGVQIKKYSSLASIGQDELFDVVLGEDNLISFVGENNRTIYYYSSLKFKTTYEGDTYKKWFVQPTLDNETTLARYNETTDKYVTIRISSITFSFKTTWESGYTGDLHYFSVKDGYEDYVTKSSIAFDYTVNDNSYTFYNNTNLSFGTKITVEKYNELYLNELSTTKFGVLYGYPNDIETLLNDTNKESCLDDLINQNKKSFAGKTASYTLCTPAKVDEQGFEADDGKYYQWGLTIQNIKDKNADVEFSIYPYIVTNNQVIFAKPRTNFSLVDAVDLYLNDSSFASYHNMLASLKTTLTKYGG